MLALFVGAYAVVWAFDLQTFFTRDNLQRVVENAGIFGGALYVGLFAAGELIHIPAWVFVFLAAALWDEVPAIIAAVVGANVSVNLSFFVVRAAGGDALTAIQKPFIKKTMQKVKERPVTTVTVLRLVLWAAPPVNYALALSGIRWRDYALGSALGLVPAIAVIAFFADQLVAFIDS